MQSFIKAVEEETDLENEDEGVIEFEHWGTPVRFFQPSEGQFLMMLAMGRRGMARDSVGNFIHLFIELGDEATQRYFSDLLMDRRSGFTTDGEGGLFDIWEGLVEEWSGKDTPEPSTSRKSSSATGTSSTAPTRSKRVTASSRSRSTNS